MPGARYLRGKWKVIIIQEVGWAQRPVWTGVVKRKYLPTQEFDPRTVQSVSIRYTDQAIPVPKYEMTLRFFLVIFILEKCRYLLNHLNPELNTICYLLALLGAHHFLHVSRITVKSLTFRRLMSYIYGAPILDVSRSHTTTQHSR